MKNHPKQPSPLAALLASLLFATASTTVFAQLSETAPETADKDEIVKLEKVTVTTGYRSPKSVDQIPGAVRLITTHEISNMLLLNDEPTAVLAQMIPGYTQSTQQMQNTSETLRGRPPLRLLDGVSQSTPLRDGSRNGTFTDMSIIDHIEVINGPSAAEGMGAAGGIINYITKTATREGSETIITTRFASQGRKDNLDSKVGLSYANKKGQTDILLSAGYIDRNMMYDANDRLVGMGASGSYMDTSESQFFVKLGHNFGKDGAQRLVFSTNQFFIQGKGNYTPDPVGNRALGITDTSHKVPALGAKAVINEFNQYTLAYNHHALFGGSLNVQVYKADQAMRFQASNTDTDKQDPLIAPLGTLLEQSEIYSTKKGMRSSWFRENLFVEGLELNVGFDYLDELTGQNLALTNRIWAPPMNYVSKAPFTQLSYARGPVTISGGLRQENGSLHVDSFTTTYFRNRAFVTGGTLTYQSNLPNVGIIVRMPKGWSTFASYSKGFTLPNIGITLRNVSVPGVRVDTLLDLQAVVVDNKEIGLSWRGSKVSFSGSVYKSYSDFGSSLAVDPTIGNYIVVRQPVEIKGAEVSGEVVLRKNLKLTMLYSHIVGRTGAATATTPALQTRMGIASISPDKLNTSLKWQYSPKLMLVLDQAATVGREINAGKSTYEKTRGSTLYNFTAGYSTKWGDFSIGIENLFNKFYIMDWSQVDQFQNYFAGRGRVISLRHSIKF